MCLFSSQIESRLSVRLYIKKHLQNSRLLQCTVTNGNSLPRMVGFGDFVLRKECDSRLFDSSECCSLCCLNMKFAVVALWSVKVASCAMWRRLLWQQHFLLWFVRNGYRKQKKKTVTYIILLSILHIVVQFPATWWKDLCIKKVHKFSTWFESVCELGLRIRTIINSPTCLVIEGENRF